MPNGVNHGLHNFLVQIRDTHTLLPKPGVIIGDMGAKLGLNGIDNGFLMFDHFRVNIDLCLTFQFSSTIFEGSTDHTPKQEWRRY